jgi:ankyrin repeat protein
VPEFEEHLARIRAALHVDPSRAEDICTELRSHLEADVERMQQTGLGREGAMALAVQSLGDPDEIARDLAKANYRHRMGGYDMAKRLAIWTGLALLVTAGVVQVRRLDAAEKRDWAPLHYAVENGRANEVAALIAKGADANATPADGNAPLILAARRGDVQTARVLLAHGAEVNVGEDFTHQCPPLQGASATGNVEMVKLLLANGANVNAVRARDDVTALRVAASRGHVDVARILLTHGAYVGSRDRLGLTTLHGAAAGGHARVVELLLAAGANVNARTHYEKMTPLQVAKTEQVKELLREHGGTL